MARIPAAFPSPYQYITAAGMPDVRSPITDAAYQVLHYAPTSFSMTTYTGHGQASMARPSDNSNNGKLQLSLDYDPAIISWYTASTPVLLTITAKGPLLHILYYFLA